MEIILVTGSKGQLGMALRSLQNSIPSSNFFFTEKQNLDITNLKAVENFVTKNNITTIINCAAFTNVDEAEDEHELANNINNIAVENLGKIAKKYQLKLIHISTDYVFDGNSEKPYSENDKTNPKNIYGITKLKGENALLNINPANTIIIRTSWLYSAFGNNFVKTILRLSKEKETISVVNNQIGSPTNAIDLAEAILKIIPLINTNQTEIYHYSNKGKCSWFQFAEEIVKLTNAKCKVLPIDSKDFKTKAKRPNFSLLNTTKIQKAFKIEISDWKESLKKHMHQIK